MKLNVLIDTHDYILNNCYQHQLFKVLKDNFEVNPITIGEIKNGNSRLEDGDTLSCLKLRTLDSNLREVQTFLKDRSVKVYEQDPWEAFKDDSPYKGSYQRIFSSLNVSSFLNTSRWWSNYINKTGVTSTFVRMGVLPEYCNEKLWEARNVEFGFCGQLHPHRKRFFDKLSSCGIQVTILPTTNYRDYLKNLSSVKVYIHSEEVDWIVDGNRLNANALWIKDVEACAQGCAAIRNVDEDIDAYGTGEDIPNKLGYTSIEDAVEKIKQVMQTSPEVMNARIEKSASYIKANLNWQDVITTLKS